MEHRSKLEPSAEQRLEGIPSLNSFFAGVHALEASGAIDVLACVELFARISSKDFATQVVNYELEKCIDEPRYLPESATDFSITLFRTAACGLDVKVVRSTYVPDSRLHGLTDDLLISVLGDETLTLDTYVQPQPIPNDVFDPSRLLIRQPDVLLTLKPQVFYAEKDVFAVGATPCDALMLFFSIPSPSKLRWEYDRHTLAPTRITAADPTSSRIQFACKTLATMGYAPAAASMQALGAHPDHHVRWTAITSLLDLDFEIGVAALEAAQNDIHPHLRAASTASLKSLESYLL